MSVFETLDDTIIPEYIRQSVLDDVRKLMDDDKLILYAQVNPRDKLVLVYRLLIQDIIVTHGMSDEALNQHSIINWLQERRVRNWKWTVSQLTEWFATFMYERHKDDK